MKTIRTMADLLEALDSLGYSAATAAQIRPEIRRCERVYGQPLARIAADAADFEERWGRGRVGTVGLGFASPDHFARWRKRVRQALGRVAVPVATTGRLPGWERLVERVHEASRAGRLPGSNRHLSLIAVARPASDAGREPWQIDSAWAAEAIMPLSRKARRSFKRGLTTLNRLRESSAAIEGLVALLPTGDLAQPPRKLALPSGFRPENPDAALLWAEFDRFVDEKRGRDALGRPVPVGHSPFRATSERTYRIAVAAALGLLERFGHLRPGDRPELAMFARPDVVRAVAAAWQTRQIAGEVSRESCTLHLMLSRLVHIGGWCGATPEAMAEMRGIIDKARRATPSHGRMSTMRRNWIRDFARQPAQQRAVHAMPDTLMREARALIARWPDLGQKEKMRALHFGIAATQAALLFRASPLRARNLRSLTFRGEGAQLYRTANGDLALSIAAELVKNRREIRAVCDAEAVPIIDWYLAEIRPRLIADHPYGHHRLDSDLLFPSARPGAPMDSTTFEDHYSRGCAAIGIDMTLHQARHISATAILSIDPGAWSAAAAVLVDTESTLRNYYAWIDEERQTAEGRALLRKALKGASHHKRGHHGKVA